MSATARARRVPVSSGARSEPMIEERREPGAAGGIVDGAVGEVGGARFRVRQERALMAARGPAADGGVRHVGMELQRIAGAVAERLHRKAVAFGEKIGAVRQIEAFAMPLV